MFLSVIASKNCSPITFQQSTKTSDVKSLRLDNIDHLVLPGPVGDAKNVFTFESISHLPYTYDASAILQ